MAEETPEEKCMECEHKEAICTVLEVENKKLREHNESLKEQNQLVRTDAMMLMRQNQDYVKYLEERLGVHEPTDGAGGKK